MANPIIPGISQAEQDLLYSKLNAYNQGRASFKEAGTYLVALPRPDTPNIHYGYIHLCRNAIPSFTSMTYLRIFMNRCG